MQDQDKKKGIKIKEKPKKWERITEVEQRFSETSPDISHEVKMKQKKGACLPAELIELPIKARPLRLIKVPALSE